MTLRSKVVTAVILAGVISTLAATLISSQKIVHQGELALTNKSRAVLSRIETVREYIASQGGLQRTVQLIKEQYPDGNLPKEAKLEILKQVPIFASMKVGGEKAEQENYRFRVFAESPRNEENTPNTKELEILKRFQANADLPEITEVTEEELIVYRPVRLSEAQGCLVCHGNPSQSPWGNGKDILGMPMEDWKDGHLHGVFAIHSSLAPVKAEAKSAIMSIVSWGVFGIILAFILAFVMIHPSLKSLKDIVEQLKNSGENVDSASKEISSYSESLSQTSSKAAAHIEQTSASSEDIQTMIVRNSDYTLKARELAALAQERANQGKDVVGSLIHSMAEITNSSKKISEIINVIDDIAFQTNLLALNASVEAARAGEHGKGFAVVADAVRSLAQRSAASAKEISSLIGESVHNIEAGSAQVEKSGSSLEEIVKVVMDLAVINSEIATLSNEQSDGVKQMNLAIRDLDSITQSNAAAAEETAAAASSLSTQASSMNTVVNQLTEIIEGKQNRGA